SRYSAYALGLVGYIVRTTDPHGPMFREDTGAWRRDLRRFCKTTQFQALEVVEAEHPEADVGFVTFRATLLQDGSDASMTERSRFERRGGEWFYLSGEWPEEEAVHGGKVTSTR
ncbi:MAG: YchJ family metal-binding protein, partial [Myxococcota bacterium]